ncbi:ABC transporter substrate-binding protein [Cutibacterium granulosum]|uniref:ABC transporter substrate-binding protein n=1 Tax=Cutibacterium granulosum TaxID=33011 RepID=UPI0027BA47BE|nr:ABC transporter substrate-binding protein [Cutibacterium granulosum]MEA5656104.1 ABC transporter substrate-binding protein [Cutibacterium granulosum]
MTQPGSGSEKPNNLGGSSSPDESSSAQDDPTILPSGAILQSEDSQPGSGSVSRRSVLTGVGGGLVAGLLVGAGVGAPIAYHKGRSSASSAEVANRPLTVIHGGDVCDAPSIVAKEKGFFDDAGLDVTLKRTVGDEDIKAAVGSGQYDASSGIFYSWLKPVEQGQNVKFVAGLHGGCLRLIVLKDSKFTDVSKLKGATIGIPNLHASATMFFSMDLLDAGINPLPEAKEVNWKVMEPSVLADALKRGEVDAIATSDPIAYLPLLKGYGVELASNMKGTNAQEFCCCTALNGDFVKNETPLARKLVEAWCRGARYVKGHEAEVAKIEVETKNVAGDVAMIERVLKTYTWKPSVTKLRNALLPGVKKFKKTGYLREDTDPQQLVDASFTTLGLDW